MDYTLFPQVNKIMREWQLRESSLASSSKKKTSNKPPVPFITVAREPGSGGDPIGRAVAKKLGYAFVDDQIIEEIAKSTKKRTQIIKAVDEKSRTAIGELIHSLLNPEYIDESKYVTELVKVILAHAYQGKTVILGRGANFMTPPEHGLHVYITAPYATRVERAMKYEGHSLRKAKKIIADVEKDRADFVEKYLSRDLNKKNSYDLVLNTQFFTVNQARDIVINAFKTKFHKLKL